MCCVAVARCIMLKVQLFQQYACNIHIAVHSFNYKSAALGPELQKRTQKIAWLGFQGALLGSKYLRG